MRKEQMLKLWGHRLPQERELIEGYVVLAYNMYHQKMIIDTNINIQESPWWYGALNKFVFNFLVSHNPEPGDIFDVKICAEFSDMKFNITTESYTKLNREVCSA